MKKPIITELERLGEAAAQISAQIEAATHDCDHAPFDAQQIDELSRIRDKLAEEQEKAGRGARGRFLAMARTSTENAMNALLRAHEASMD